MKKGLITAPEAENDRREVHVQLTPRGDRVLAELTRHMRAELRSAAPALVATLRRLGHTGPNSLSGARRHFLGGVRGDDQPREYPRRLGVDGANPLQPDGRAMRRFAGGPISHRNGVGAGGRDRNRGGDHCLPAIQPDRAVHQHLSFYHHVSFAFRSAREQPSWTAGHCHPGHRRHHRGDHGALRLRQDSRPRHSRSDGSGLVNRSRIEPKVAILKPLSAAIAIGTGGPFGAEGPIIQTGGAIGSLVGQLMHTTAAERKVLLACGAAAGMAATFSTPIAGVILAIELLLFEFKSRSFIPLVIASTLATSVHFRLMGRGPMFTVGRAGLRAAACPAVLPGAGCSLRVRALGFSKLLYWVEDQFEKLPVHEMWWPAIGALGLRHHRILRPARAGRGLRHHLRHPEYQDAAGRDCWR